MSRLYKFHNFLLENKISELLLEGNLIASDKFLSRLQNINNNIAQTLYKSFKDKVYIDRDLAQNYIDITDKEDAVSFISDRNASRMGTDGIYSARGRNEVKIGRLARTILSDLKIKFTDKDIEEFVNLYKSSKVDTTKKFKLVSGLDIKKYYNENNYSILSGSLGGSCMRHEDCQSYFKIYTRNPEQCQLLVYFDENEKVLGRALIWKISECELYTKNTEPYKGDNPKFFMDRVYVSIDSDVNKFIEYANSNEWIYKNRMTADDKESLIFKYKGEILIGRIIVKLNRLHFSKYPYVDTLKFTDGDSRISNVGFYIEPNEDDDEGFIMCDTDGGRDECSDCGGTGREDSNDNNCRKCHGDGEVDCSNCRGRGQTICTDCDGRGDINCNSCNGQGDIDCNRCDGGYIECRSCNGHGDKRCETCRGEGNIGKCKDCDGECEIKCPTCKGEELTCKTCNGEGTYVRKWGRGTRRVTCKDCGGEGKSNKGENGQEGCKCPECSRPVFSWGYFRSSTGWENRGTIVCKGCEGRGEIECEDCDGDGTIECKDCDGRGGSDCNHCDGSGTIDCKDCRGRGTIGECQTCDGEGTTGDCKLCDDGTVKCSDCGGSGERPKGQKAELCFNCAGILKDLMTDIQKNRYTIR